MNAKNWIIEFWHFRELLVALTLREIKIRYKQTLLGTAWAVLQPAALAVIFSIIFGHFLQIESPQTPYIVFYYSALVPWTFFSNSVTFGALSVINNSNLVTKVYFPREILPLAALGAAFLDFLMATVLFVALLVFYKIPLSVNLIFVIPIVGILIIFTTAVILVTSALNVVWRDVKFVVPLLTQLWMFVTPVIYPTSKVPQNLRAIYMLNPMAPIIDNLRAVTVLNKSPQWADLGIATIISVTALIAAYIFFKRKEKVFADII